MHWWRVAGAHVDIIDKERGILGTRPRKSFFERRVDGDPIPDRRTADRLGRGVQKHLGNAVHVNDHVIAIHQHGRDWQ